MKSQDLEQRLASGEEVTLSAENRIPELEQHYNLVFGGLYRTSVSGMNPTDVMTFDGVLTSLTIYQDSQGPALKRIALKDGLKYDSTSAKQFFETETIVFDEGTRLVRFGRILDEDGFRKAVEIVKDCWEKPKVLVYIPQGDNPVIKSLYRTLSSVTDPNRVTLTSDLRNELETGNYRLVIDASALVAGKNAGTIADEIKRMELSVPPEVVRVTDATKVLTDVIRHVAQFYSQNR